MNPSLESEAYQNLALAGAAAEAGIIVEVDALPGDCELIHPNPEVGTPCWFRACEASEFVELGPAG